MSAGRSRYEILAKIASGGMATVYVGRVRGAVGFSRLIAIKRPHPFVTEDPALKEQLESEARVASMIHHPNVVSVLDVEQLGDELVLVMDYVEGCTLKTLNDHVAGAIRDTSFARMAIRIVLDVSAGLHAAHRLRDGAGASLGVIHRDVSPQNVLVGLDGTARLTDFGIAKIAGADGDPTATDVIKGKTAYLPPEYVLSRRFDARSDLFALGVVAWEALARQRLFRGATTVETLSNILQGNVPRLGSVRPELSALDDVIARAIAREHGDRYPSVEAFAAALESRARSLDLVASHAEVAALVERVAGAVVIDRRRIIEAGVSAGLDVGPDAHRPGAHRDQLETISVPVVPVVQEAAEAPSVSSRRRGTVAAFVAAVVALFVAAPASVMALRAERGKPTNDVAVDPAPGAAPSASAPAAAATESEPPTGSSSSSVERLPPAPSAAPIGASTRRARPSPRASAPSLLPAHAPPNPYAR